MHVLAQPRLEGAADPDWQALRAELIGFVEQRVHDPDLAEDIVHDVLFRALVRQDDLRDAGRLRPWLFQIARNAVADHYRTRPPVAPLSDDMPAGDDTNPPDDGDNAERRLADCCVGEFVNRLPDGYRQAVTLGELEGLKQREVADRLGLTVSGAKSRVRHSPAKRDHAYVVAGLCPYLTVTLPTIPAG